MLASGKVKKCYWHQLVAPGYGLVNNLDGEIKKRDAYFLFQAFDHDILWWKYKEIHSEKNLYCLIVEKRTIIEAVWSNDGNATFKSKPCQPNF